MYIVLPYNSKYVYACLPAALTTDAYYYPASILTDQIKKDCSFGRRCVRLIHYPHGCSIFLDDLMRSQRVVVLAVVRSDSVQCRRLTEHEHSSGTKRLCTRAHTTTQAGMWHSRFLLLPTRQITKKCHTAETV